MLDLDHFKQVNDKWGHPAGDDVLVEVVRRIRGLLRKTDLLARYGGEEFAILLPHQSIEQSRLVAQRLCDALEAQDFAVAGRWLSISASFGVFAALPRSELDTSDFLHRADEALYTAKEEGRACVRCWQAPD